MDDDDVSKNKNGFQFRTIISGNKRQILNRNKHFNFHQLLTSKSKDLIKFQNKSDVIRPCKLDISSTIKNQIKYSNEKLFINRISKGMKFFNKMNLKSNRINKISSFNDKLKYNLSNALMSPINKINIYKKLSFPRLKRVISPKNISKSFDDMNNNKKEKEKEKTFIRDNLCSLLYKIKQRIMPKRKLNFEKDKLPEINNKINLKKVPIKSCIHQEENFKGKIEFIKTHLDGIIKPSNLYKKKYKSEKRFEINDGYIDLEVLGEGENISYKTDIIDKKGQIYYVFHKKGGMVAIEEKIHKVKKDEKEFIRLLERYNQNEIFQSIKDKDFNNAKKNYSTPLSINKNIYKDLFHILFNNKDKKAKISYKSLILY